MIFNKIGPFALFSKTKVLETLKIRVVLRQIFDKNRLKTSFKNIFIMYVSKTYDNKRKVLIFSPKIVKE